MGNLFSAEKQPSIFIEFFNSIGRTQKPGEGFPASAIGEKFLPALGMP